MALKVVYNFQNLLFNKEMRNIIVECTNKQIEDVCAQMVAESATMQTYDHTTCLLEINAFIALLYYSGMWKSNHVDIHKLWSNFSGYNMYRCVMPRVRFMFLATWLHFDVRENRLADDSLSPIRKL